MRRAEKWIEKWILCEKADDFVNYVKIDYTPVIWCQDNINLLPSNSIHKNYLIITVRRKINPLLQSALIANSYDQSIEWSQICKKKKKIDRQVTSQMVFYKN